MLAKNQLLSYWKAKKIIKAEQLFQAFLAIKREDFVLPEYRHQAYEDTPLPLGHGATISQPTTVMLMLQALKPKQGDNILEIGTGSGYNAALLSYLVGIKGKVTTIEYVKELFDYASERLKDFKNVKILIGGDRRVYDVINVDETRKSFSDFVPVKDFAKLLKSFDIPFAPLSSAYDMRRSWVKVLEYMVLQIPWIATDCITYEELKPYGKTVINTEENWYNAIVETIQNLPREREYACHDPYQFALTQDVDVQLDNRLKIYQEIIGMEYPERRVYEPIQESVEE